MADQPTLRQRLAPWRQRPAAPAPPAPHKHPRISQRLGRLGERVSRAEVLIEEQRRRIVQLEEGIQEERALNLRVAELTDVVTTLVAAAAQGPEAFRRALDAVEAGAADEEPEPTGPVRS